MMRGWFIVGMALAALSGGVSRAEELRRWKSVAGAEVEARLIEQAGTDAVVLETSAGRRISIRIDQLSEADRAYLAAREPEAGAAESPDDEGVSTGSGVPPPAKGGWLPALADGPYAGHFAVYESPLYVYVVNTFGGGAILLKDGQGRVTGPTVPLRPWRIHYIGPDTRAGREGRQRSASRSVKALVGTPPKPAINPDRIELNGVFDDDVTFKKVFEFSRDAVRLSFEIRDPPRIQYPTRGGELGFGRFLATDRITGQTPLAEQKRFFDGWGIAIQPVGRNARPRTITFWESVNEKSTDISQATIRGPWGERSLAVKFIGAPGRISVYTGQSIWQGYSMGFSWLWSETRRPVMEITIR